MKRIAVLTLLMLATWSATAQNPVVPFRTPRATFTTAAGQPLSGGCIFTYLGGTTTPQPTYTDFTGGTSNPNPVILDAAGSATMWLGANSYKFVAYSAGGSNCGSGSLQWTVDQVPGDAFLNGTISGATITNPTITGGTESGTAISGDTIAGSSITSSPISGAAGAFTSLSSAYNAMAFSATPVFSASSYGYFQMTLTGNVTSSTITGGAAGQQVIFDICQNSVGGFTFVWPGGLSGVSGAPAINLAPNACTVVSAFNNSVGWVAFYSTPQLIFGNFNSVGFSATPVFNAASYSSFTMILSANVSSSTIIGGVAGGVANFQICQNGTGGYTFAWPVNLANPPLVNRAPSACTGLSAIQNNFGNWVTVASTSYPAAQQSFNAMTFSATPTFAAGSYSFFSMTLTANVTSGTITGGVAGQIIGINLCQDGTGSRTVVWPGNLLNAPTVNSTASSCSSVIAFYDGTNWNVLGSVS